MATNVQTEIKGNKLVITIDVSDTTKQHAPLSASGKNKVVASTHGFLALQNGLSVGLNVICK